MNPKNAAKEHQFHSSHYYDCEVHGKVVEVFKINFEVTRAMCVRCMFDKLIELGVKDLHNVEVLK